MAQDLVGTPMRVIEQRTAENAARIQLKTGLRPGMAPHRASVSADPGQSGRWSPVVDTPVVPVFDASGVPLHPNAAGMQAMASAILAKIRAHGHK